MGRMVKCPYCENKVDKDESFEYKKRYYHRECFEVWQRESQDYKDLVVYICELYRLQAPTGMMLKQLKEYREELHYKSKGMELALRYFYETLGNSVQDGTGVGIIPYVYEDAKKHYIMRMKVKESVEANGDKQTEIKKVVINSPKPTYKSKIKPIDIGAL